MVTRRVMTQKALWASLLLVASVAAGGGSADTCTVGWAELSIVSRVMGLPPRGVPRLAAGWDNRSHF